MLRKLLYIMVAILAVVAVVLVYNVYRQISGQQVSDQSGQATQSNANTSQPSQFTPVATEAELLFRIPLAGSTQDERAKFNEEVKKFAKQALAIEIANATPFPLVFKVKPETEFKINNKDNVEYTIDVGTGQIITLPPNGTVSVKSGKGNGYYLETDLLYINGTYKGFISIDK